MADAAQPKRIWGSHEHKLDAKGRLSIPNEFRVLLGLEENDVLVVTRDAASPSLLVFWEDAWKAFEDKAERLAERRQAALWAKIEAGELEVDGDLGEAAEDLMRQYHRRVKLDRLGRIQLPAMLRGFAKLQGGDPCRILGKGGAISVWADEQACAAHDASKFARQKTRVSMLLRSAGTPGAGSDE